MQWRHLPIVAFDTETTGLQPFGGDRVIEFAAVVLRIDASGQVVGEERHGWLLNPGIPIPRTASEISGITDKDVADAPTFADVAHEVAELLGNAVTVAHNYPFDMAFLTQELLRVGLTWPEPLAEVDTVDLSMKHFSEAKGHKLIDLCTRLGVSLDGAHRATNDAAACGRCFVEMVRKHEIRDDLQTMLDWANAIGRPPEDGPLGASRDGRVVFLDGPHKGDPIVDHPIHLAWMEKARERGPEGWRFRYPESTRRWVRRWLEVRGAGRARQSPKSFRPEDWVLDSCIAPLPAPDGLAAARA
jgi:DNA polymerase III epsilon subunit family exonuclease